MNPRRSAYVAVPITLLIVWAVVYAAWLRQQPKDHGLRVDQLPAPSLVWPEPSPTPDSPDVAAAKQRLEKMQAELIANAAEELRARREQALRDGSVFQRPDENTAPTP